MKKNQIMGLLVLALVSAMGLADCANEIKAVRDTPIEQRASLYLPTTGSISARIVKLNGKGIGMAGFTRKGEPKPGFVQSNIPGTVLNGTTRIAKAMEVAPGEQTITLQGNRAIGSKSVDGTFNFEAGKNYFIMLTTPGNYRNMMTPGFDGFLTNLGEDLKDELAGNFIMILAETQSNRPEFPERNLEWKIISSVSE